MLPKGDVEGRFRAPSGMDNSLQSAKKRFSTMILLAQSYFAEMMYDRGFGRQTFRIIPVNENNPDDFIFVQNATKTLDVYKRQGVTIYDPQTGQSQTMYHANADSMFSSAGNIFYSVMKEDNK